MDCGSFTDPANGQVDHTSGTTLGQTATYSCNSGYNLVGDRTRTCQAIGNWSGSAPTCQSMYVINLASFPGPSHHPFCDYCMYKLGCGVSSAGHVVHVVVHGEWVMLWARRYNLMLLDMTGTVQKVWRHEQCVQHVRV